MDTEMAFPYVTYYHRYVNRVEEEDDSLSTYHSVDFE